MTRSFRMVLPKWAGKPEGWNGYSLRLQRECLCINDLPGRVINWLAVH